MNGTDQDQRRYRLTGNIDCLFASLFEIFFILAIKISAKLIFGENSDFFTSTWFSNGVEHLVKRISIRLFTSGENCDLRCPLRIFRTLKIWVNLKFSFAKSQTLEEVIGRKKSPFFFEVMIIICSLQKAMTVSVISYPKSQIWIVIDLLQKKFSESKTRTRKPVSLNLPVLVLIILTDRYQ